MTGAADPVLDDAPEGGLAVRGPLTFDTVGRLWSEVRARLGTGASMGVDLAGVDRADSAGLALLVECLRVARLGGGDLRFLNAPDQLRAIARLSRLEDSLFADA